VIKRILISLILPLFFVTTILAKEAPSIQETEKVFTKDGNIYYASNGKAAQVTSSGRDEYPMLHPKEEWIYFIRTTAGKWIGDKYYPAKGEVIKDGVLQDELWRVKKDGTQAKLLFRNNRFAIDGPDPDYVSASIYNIQFSPDGDKVYFETPNWVTSAGLHVMNPDGSRERMLGPGNQTKIILSASERDPKYGSCRGFIISSHHRYWWFGGSYDWWYLFTPDFKEIGPLGDDFDYFTEMGDIIYTDHSEKTIKRSEKLKSRVNGS